MAYVPLTGAAYSSRTLIAAAQRCVNLFPETIPQEQGEQTPTVHVPTPGLTLLSTASQAIIRGLYTTGGGDLYAVAGQSLYYVSPTWTWTKVGDIVGSDTSDAAYHWNPVSMADSGTILMLLDSSVDGWTYDLVEQGASFARMSSKITQVQATVINPTITVGDTIYINSVEMDIPETASSLADVVTLINQTAAVNDSLSTVVALVQTEGLYKGALLIQDTTGADVTIGDGTANGALGLTQGIVSTGGFYGGDVVQYSDTYFICNKPNSPIFVVSDSETTDFEPLSFASKVAKSDNLVTLAVVRRVLWLIGTYNTELWQDTGGGGNGALSVNTFPYEAIPGMNFQTGCAAKYSLATIEDSSFWLAQTIGGSAHVVMTNGYQIDRISTYAIEAEIAEYSVISDAIGMVYRQAGHVFYMLSFPTADKTWVYDLTTHLWHERTWLDANGQEHRHRANCMAFAYGKVVCGDYQNGNLYALDPDNYTDNGAPIKRLRSFPHQIDPQANRRVFYRQLIANMEVGTASLPSGVNTIVNASFSAPDGTLLQNYAGAGDIGAAFTQTVSGTTGEILGDAFVGIGAGATAYVASGIPTSADYTVSFVAAPDSYTAVSSSDIYVIARAVEASSVYTGYRCKISGNGSQYSVILDNFTTGNLASVVLGVLASGQYNVQMVLSGPSIQVTVQRSQDNAFCNPQGTWVMGSVPAIVVTDTTFQTPGRVLIGGDW